MVVWRLNASSGLSRMIPSSKPIMTSKNVETTITHILFRDRLAWKRDLFSPFQAFGVRLCLSMSLICVWIPCRSTHIHAERGSSSTTKNRLSLCFGSRGLFLTKIQPEPYFQFFNHCFVSPQKLGQLAQCFNHTLACFMTKVLHLDLNLGSNEYTGGTVEREKKKRVLPRWRFK